jgi:hypothetical protein
LSSRRGSPYPLDTSTKIFPFAVIAVLPFDKRTLSELNPRWSHDKGYRASTRTKLLNQGIHQHQGIG